MTTTQPTTPPPDVDLQHDDGDGDAPDISRVAIHVIRVDDQGFDIGTNLIGDRATDPDAWAEALLQIAHGMAGLLGQDYAWALDRRLAGHDGQAS